MNEKLSPVFERLRRRTIYSEKDFKTPQEILQRSLKLSKYRDNDPDAFVRETTMMFSNFSRSKKTEDIDVNDLIAALFALRDNPDKSKYRFPDSIKQIEIGLLIDSLLGKNLDFILGKKDSSIILPSYLILRSLKERDSYWTFPFYGKKSGRQQAVELKNGLLRCIHTKNARLALEKKFERSLTLEEIGSRVPFIELPPKKDLLKMPRGFKPVTLETAINYPSADPFSDFNIKKIRPDIKDSSVLSDERIFFDLILKHGKISVDKNGQINFSEKSLRNILDGIVKDEDLKKLYDRLRPVLGSRKIISLLSPASLISKFSDDIRPDSASWFFIDKDPQHVIRLVHSFDRSLLNLFKKINNYESIGLEKVIGKTGEFNFSEINRQLVLDLYKNYTGKLDPSSQDLEIFMKLPGIDLTIMTLRKLSLTKVLQRTLTQIGYDHEKFLSPYLVPFSVIAADLNPQVMINLSKDGIDVEELINITQVDIIKELAYYSVEKYLIDNKKGLNKNRTMKAKDLPKNKRILFVLDDLEPEKLNIFNTTGLPLPIRTAYDVENDKLDIYFFDIYLGRILIDVEKV